MHGRRYTILPVLTLDGLITWDIIEGSVTVEHFLQFLCEHVVCDNALFLSFEPSDCFLIQIPLTNPYPGPHSVLVLDNCSIHHANEVGELVEEQAGLFSNLQAAISIDCSA